MNKILKIKFNYKQRYFFDFNENKLCECYKICYVVTLLGPIKPVLYLEMKYSKLKIHFINKILIIS